MKIKISKFTLSALLVLLISGKGSTVFISFPAIALHESGHLFAARLVGVKPKSLSFDMLGAQIVLSENLLSYGKEIAIAVSGPIFNIISALIAYLAFPQSSISNSFIAISFSLALINLLPIGDFDGGRLLLGVLCLLFNRSFAERILSVLSFLVSFFIWIFSSYMLIRFSKSISLFVFILGILVRSFSKKTSVYF